MGENEKVYQVQYWGIIDYDSNEKGWISLSTKSGGKFCNSLKGAKAKVKQERKYAWGEQRKFRIVSFELVNETVEEEYDLSE